MGSKPTIYLTNAASRKPPYRGPGRVLTIMAAPRRWEHGDGRVTALVPPLGWVQQAKDGRMSMVEYRHRYLRRIDEALTRGDLDPERMYTTAEGGTAVRDGDTLICACSRDAARAGRCHRAWAAEALLAAGWRIVLDGVPDE